MSKELIISANRHETRVAVVEDDQVTEVFHQRENEYSLAGSIHKGRVTRVLPGMQSAFVDIGLERDAFLYVSDFFEDNDEYDKIVTSVEEKVFKLDRPLAAQSMAPPAPSEAEVELISEAEAEVNAPPAAAAAAPVSSGAAVGRDGRDDRDRRGRRSRRRRGGKGGGRGLPDAKFYSPRTEDADAEAESDAGFGGDAAEPEPADTGGLSVEPVRTATPVRHAETHADDFFVLPGESLAKYSHADTEGEEEDASAALDGEPEAEEITVEISLEVETGTTALEDLAEPVAVMEAAAPATETAAEIAVPPEPELKAAVELVEEFEDGADSEAADEAEAEAEAGIEAEGEVEAEADTDAETEIETAEDLDVPASDAAEPVDDLEGESQSEEEQDGEAVAQAATGEGSETGAVVEDEGPEPARIPTSLTATLREQNPRYQHRVSRRTRRRGRDGQPRDPQAPGQGREGQGREGHSRGGPNRPEQNRETQNREGQPRDNQTREVRGPAAPDPGTARQVQHEPRVQPDSRTERGAPSISDLLKEGQEIIVQIAKEPLGQKGARITSHIALPGRFLVYMPTVDHIGVSRKIPSEEERTRLKRVLQAHRTGIPGGYIVRTAGDGRTEEELRADMMFLYNMWLDMRQKAERKPAPLLIHHDLNVVERILRDQLTSNFKSIWVDNEDIYENTLRFVQRFQPTLVGRVKMYTRSTPIFDEFGVTAELEKALRPKVWLKSGGYIVINQTEALVAIDVNTGKFVGKSNRLEDTIVKTNTDAIKEIVRQIRLRDLGGIIVVDFIDMDERKNRQKVMQVLEEAMRADRAPYKILQFNDFGLVAITRKRVKQSLERTLCTPCTYCEGAGYVKSPLTVVGEILTEAHKISRAVEGKDVLLRVNPEVAKLLKSNQNTYLQEVEEILGGRTVIVKSDPQLHQEKFDLA